MQWPRQESNPRPSGLQHSASTNYATACTLCQYVRNWGSVLFSNERVGSNKNGSQNGPCLNLGPWIPLWILSFPLAKYQHNPSKIGHDRFLHMLSISLLIKQCNQSCWKSAFCPVGIRRSFPWGKEWLERETDLLLRSSAEIMNVGVIPPLRHT
jgi:hypothetical protein